MPANKSSLIQLTGMSVSLFGVDLGLCCQLELNGRSVQLIGQKQVLETCDLLT